MRRGLEQELGECLVISDNAGQLAAAGAGESAVGRFPIHHRYGDRRERAFPMLEVTLAKG